MIAIVKSNFNEEITDKLLDSCTNELDTHKIHYVLFKVAGAFEIPFVVKKLLDTNKYKAIIAIGSVIRGDTYHFETIANESARALMNLNMEGKTPVINGILTCNTDKQAEDRICKGADFAKTALEMINICAKLN